MSNLPLTLQDGTPPPAGFDAGTPQTTTSGTPPTAEGGGAAPPPGGMSWLPFVLIFAVVWFLMINPERKNRKKREAMLKELKKGDRVMTTSGIYGQIVQIQDQGVTLQIADGVRVKMNLGSVQQLEGEPVESVEKAKA